MIFAYQKSIGLQVCLHVGFDMKYLTRPVV